MRFSHYFVDRPIFAAVLSIILTIAGAITLTRLPVSEYPEIAPPTVSITASYPGASAQVISETVATPIEQEVNGVDDMLYIGSQATGDGRLTINVVFKPGTDIDTAQVLVQNRVAVATPRLPEDVTRLGITVKKASPDLMMVVHLVSPDGTRNQQYISNYATLYIKDLLARVDGVGNINIFGARDYAMRIWVDPDRAAARGLTAGDVTAAVRAANLQVAAGALNQPPARSDGAYEVAVETLGRLTSPEQFEDIVLRADPDGGYLRLRDVARVELGAQDYSVNAYLNGDAATAIVVYQRPGSNALSTAKAVFAAMEIAKRDFPSGLDYKVVYNPTEFIRKSVDEVVQTLFEAVALVVIVILVFLQSWRAAIIPVVAIPVSLVGCFLVMGAVGLTFNNLSLFGLVLAIGIVVDDAIVVVENIERYIAEGLDPREASHRTMDEVGGALLAIALVLCAVFVPTAFILGLQGAFYRQFAITIAAATLISCFVSLTLSPALGAILLKSGHEPAGRFARLERPFTAVANAFNRGFDAIARGFGSLTARLVRVAAVMLLCYAVLVGFAYRLLTVTPTGLIPQLDRGYLIAAIQLPPGSSLARTDAVVKAAIEIALKRPGVANAVAFAGFDGATFTNAPNAGVIFITLKPFEERVRAALPAIAVAADLRKQLASVNQAFALVIEPPSVPGIGTGGGLKGYVQDRAGRGLPALEATAWQVAGAARQSPGIVQAYTLFNNRTPQVFADIDRTKAELMGVPIGRVFEALSVYLGSSYINDFNILGRTYKVTAQADNEFRIDTTDVGSLRMRNSDGDMVPIGSVARFKDASGPYRVPRYNLYPAAEVNLQLAKGYSTGQAIATLEAINAKALSQGFGFEWTEIALQEKLSGNTAAVAFGLAVVFVFLLLAALYENWLLPLAVVLIVPMCILAAMIGIDLRSLDRNILVEIGLIVLVGLAAKNAILIVEFAKQAEEQGAKTIDAVSTAARLRLRPIVMTSFAFILGVLPLAIATGAGAEMRQSLGTAVFFGMIGVTLFGLLFTPTFYVVVRRIEKWFGARRRQPV
ncbi:Putative component of multidrug efflux pump, acrB/acrD/acrF family [Bradyrhizobium sp. ORS 278]|uniref:efflux RND transporter permease subunit n=1 Tax=Bradyrhizobium sp. (strain ORS 278) TaxID=114615 RepID=UPI0001508465|nr:multidrug efflux RND transporter permease subunit [Bradyrhizobium sp. ORS 278]CAL78154.1 Putative component of multidrug efflux pump, acrB/acrD/acrF family [Bradyrhizobium sp. ORS 278]